MKFTKKAFILTICLALLAGTAVFGTIAYLTDTEEVTNTFSIGDVDITLDEASVNENGQPLDENGNVVDDSGDAARVESNNYLLIPGRTYVKDPTMTVSQGSQAAYYRMMVTINNYADLNAISQRINGQDFLPQMFVNNSWKPEVWACVSESIDTEADTVTYEFRYQEDAENPIDTTDGAVELPALFETFTLPGEFTNDDLKAINEPTLTITVVGHAMQQVGFEGDVDAAWAMFDAQMSQNVTPIM